MPLVAGIDCGTGFTKAVIAVQEAGQPPRVVGRGRERSGVNVDQAADAALAAALKEAGAARSDVEYIAATGFGRYGLSARDIQLTEITSAARAAHFLFPTANTVLDIGAQCTRAIGITEAGKVRVFKSNDKCAAGSGMFIARAAKYLEVSLESVGGLSMRATHPQPISSVCAVLAESEIINHVSAGVSVEDILRGIHESLAERAGGLLKRVGMDGEVTFIGGVARQEGIIRALEERLGVKVNVPPDCDYVCAMGAALLGLKRVAARAAVAVAEDVAVVQARGFRLVTPGMPLEACEFGLGPAADEVIVEIAGCGICHTDVGFADGSVPTRRPLPLVLGHEICGRVVATGKHAEEWANKLIVVPAVIPCGTCAACKAGKPTICRNQFMPGNDGDGGFATHVRVPARGLCFVREPLPAGIKAAHLSVVADAVTTPYEAIRRSGLGANDIAVVIGVGGIGGFGVQIAAALGAAVVAIDIDDEKLALAAQHGAGLTLNASANDEKAIKSAVRSFAKQQRPGGVGLKIFEMSGTAAGQATAFSLLDYGAHLAVVGFTPKKLELRLSNLMAFDATARGNWGCPPEQYPAALQMVLDGKIAIAPYVEERPLDDAPRVFEAVMRHEFKRRVILTPHGGN
ncbi:MAG TPA: 6-hydroxycyclohex-1-ene-1-carbonyl-CoA dehydrogenase [Terriglobales bacterium]